MEYHRHLVVQNTHVSLERLFQILSLWCDPCCVPQVPLGCVPFNLVCRDRLSAHGGVVRAQINDCLNVGWFRCFSLVCIFDFSQHDDVLPHLGTAAIGLSQKEAPGIPLGAAVLTRVRPFCLSRNVCRHCRCRRDRSSTGPAAEVMPSYFKVL